MSKPKPKNKKLYEDVKRLADKIYDRHSAYKSGFIVKKYKEMGGEYIGSKKDTNLDRWFKEEWKDVNPNKTKSSYPVYRPTKRINKKTPLTIDEIDREDLLKKAILKQKIKNKKLGKFKAK